MIGCREYFDGFQQALEQCISKRVHQKGFIEIIKLLKATKKNRKKIILIGNGGSSAIAEHMAIDLTKNAGLRAIAFSGTPLITTLSNDYGYELAFSKAIESYADRKDVLIAISSGGQSKNILNACKAAKQKGVTVITFSGFKADNPLRKIGKVNIWVDSKSYGYVELIHNFLIHYINDEIIGKVVY